MDWLWGLLVVIGLVFSTIAKSRKKSQEVDPELYSDDSADEYDGTLEGYSLEDQYNAETQYNAEEAPRRVYPPQTLTSVDSFAASQSNDKQIAGDSSLPEPQPFVAELLGEEFDLRRAVIESEILTPKWVTQ